MNFVEFLSERFGSMTKPSRIELMEVLNQIPDLEVLIQPYVTEPSEYPYGRNVIVNTDEVEVIVVNLPAKSKTYIHDHGKSEGWGRIIQGQLINAVYEVIEEDQVRIISEDKVHAGHIFHTPQGMIHQMVNRESERVVSLHIYSPPLQGLKVYPQPELQNIS